MVVYHHIELKGSRSSQSALLKKTANFQNPDSSLLRETEPERNTARESCAVQSHVLCQLFGTSTYEPLKINMMTFFHSDLHGSMNPSESGLQLGAGSAKDRHYLCVGLWIRIHLIRIQIQHFKWIWIQSRSSILSESRPNPDPGFWRPKPEEEENTAENFVYTIIAI